MPRSYNAGMPALYRLNPAAFARLASGWLLVTGGAILTPLPIPVGLLMLSLGLLLLARDSRWMRRRLRALRGRHPRLSRRLTRLGGHVPAGLARLIRLTEPRRGPRHAERFRDP